MSTKHYVLFIATMLMLLGATAQKQNNNTIKNVKQNLAGQMAKYNHFMHPWYDTVTHTFQLPALHNENMHGEINRQVQPQLSAQPFYKNAALNFHLVKDLNTIATANPENYGYTEFNPQFAVLNNVSYFAADDGVHGKELWRSDGTNAGTFMVKDINTGEAPSNPTYAVAANGKIYFAATTPAYGTEIWISDGTAAGTQLLKDVAVGVNSNTLFFIYAANNTVYFTCSGYNYNSALWKTDGTTAGTVLVKDTHSPEDNYTRELTQLVYTNGLLYFTAYSAVAGRELWRSDGTTNGTFLLKDINPEPDWDGPSSLTPYNNQLYFVAKDGVSRKLWHTDGTTAGTQLAAGNNGVTFNDYYYSYFQNIPFTIVGSTMYMTAYKANTGAELYKYDVSNTAGIVLVKDLNPGSTSSSISFFNMKVIGTTIYFSVVNTDNSSTLWSTKGKTNNTKVIKSFGPNEYMYNFTPYNDSLLFTKYDTAYGYELWKSNGTAAGTALLKDINAGSYSGNPYNITPCNGKIFFGATTLNKGTELWATDGTLAGTALIKDINKTTTAGSYAAALSETALANGIVFSAVTPENSLQLYKSDGTDASTVLIGNPVLGENHNGIKDMITKGNNAYYISTDYSTGSSTASICKTDGSTITKIVETSYLTHFIISYAVASNGIVFYILNDNSNGSHQLWRTDGTATGTFMLTVTNNQSNALVTLGNNVFFQGSEQVHGSELWKSDGTVLGTQMVQDTYPGEIGSAPYSFFVYKNNLYFGAYVATGYGLWKTDGTSAATIKLADVEPFPAYNDASPFCISNNTLYFNGNTSAYGHELWKTNGTTAGTVLVKDINPGITGSNPLKLTDVNGSLFFTADNGIKGTELWASKGEAVNTSIVKDISPGSSGTLFIDFVSAGGKLFFNVNNSMLWMSDGTQAGTLQITDAGIANVTSITGFTANGSKLFFSGLSYQYGFELYQGDVTSLTFAMANAGEAAALKNTAAFNATVYPNPASSKAVLHVTGNSKNSTATLTNTAGQILWQTSLKENQQINLPVEKLKPGIYIVSIKSSAETKTVKFVKQ